MIYSSISHASINEELDCFQFHTNHNKYKYLFWNKVENIKYREVLGRIRMFSSKEISLRDWAIDVYYFFSMLIKCLLDAAKLFSLNNQFIMAQSFTDIQWSWDG